MADSQVTVKTLRVGEITEDALSIYFEPITHNSNGTQMNGEPTSGAFFVIHPKFELLNFPRWNTEQWDWLL